MSLINTSGISSNYPVPGVNNNSQGFRDNFTTIKNNLNQASTEITELQSKAVLKSGLSDIPLDNDMSGALISNALVRGFRSTTYNLGSNLSGTIVIDLTVADVQYGTATGNTVLQFARWAPTGTQSNVQVIFTVIPGQTINLPPEVTDGQQTLEGYDPVTRNITIPAGVTRVHYNFSTIDCGTNIEVQPLDRPRTATVVGGGNYISNGAARVQAYSANSNITVTGSMIPTSDITYDLGTSGLRWRDLYMSGNTIYIGNQTITINGEFTRVGNLWASNSQLGDTALANYFIGGDGEFDQLTAKIGADLGPISNIKIAGGASGQFLQTDGTGNLTWANVSQSNAIPAIYFEANASGNNQQFSNSYLTGYTSNTDITLFLNGSLLENQFYTLSGNVLTVTTSLDVGDSIDVVREVTQAATITNILSSTPQTKNSDSIGVPGQIAWDDQYFYVCTALNTWKRTPLTGGY
jgi:hypothetical protein